MIVVFCRCTSLKRRPAQMIKLKTRPYRDETDLYAIADLLNACEVVDRLEQWTSVSDLQLEFNDPSLDKAKDILLWENPDRKLIGFNQIWIPQTGEANDGFLWFRVHPEARGGEIERQMIAWGERRMREVAAKRGVGMKLRTGVRDRQIDRIALLESCGFTSDREFQTMERSLSEPISEPQLPSGFTLRHAQGSQEAEAWVEMRNQACIDHWNYHPLTVEEHVHWLTDPNYRPELDLIAVARDRTFAAFCSCNIFPQENERNGSNDGWISSLGTRRGFRRLGLGRAMLLAGMNQLKIAGMEKVRLGVDAKNPNGARQLYESSGFRKLHSSVLYVKADLRLHSGATQC
jgi:mycothiol synthase